MRSLITLCFLASTAHAVEVSYGMGESSFERLNDRLKACTVAENLAVKDALLKYNGKEFQASQETLCVDTKEHSYCNYLKEITSTTAGTVRSVVERNKKIRNNTCFVEVKVEVEKSRQLNANVESKRIYRVGDNLQFEVNTGEPLYLYVFNLHRKGVDLIFPNKYNSNALIDEKFSFPADDLKVTAYLDSKVNISNETLLFLFTKRRQDVQEDVSKDELKDLLSSIPVFEKKLIQHNVVIKRSEK